MEAIYYYFFKKRLPYHSLAEGVFIAHLIWTILSPLQMVFLYFFGAAYVPYFILYAALNIFAPMPFKGCPLTKLEKYFREKDKDTLDIQLTFVQRLCKRWFNFVPPRWKVHLIHGSAYAIAILMSLNFLN